MDPTVDSADWSEVFVSADEGAFLDMAQTEFSGHIIGMLVDDMLSRGKRNRTVPDTKPGVLSPRQDQTEFVGESASVPRARAGQEGAPYATRRLKRESGPLLSDPKRTVHTAQCWRCQKLV